MDALSNCENRILTSNMMCGGGNVIGGDRSFTWLNGLIWIHVQQGKNERGCLKKYDSFYPLLAYQS